jgi:hypothetical protein
MFRTFVFIFLVKVGQVTCRLVNLETLVHVGDCKRPKGKPLLPHIEGVAWPNVYFSFAENDTISFEGGTI